MVSPKEFRVQREDLQGGVVRVTPEGELDLGTTSRLEAELEAPIASARHLVLDLAKLRFVDSTGLRMFLLLAERARCEGWQLTLARPSPAITAILEVTGTTGALPIVADWSAGS